MQVTGMYEADYGARQRACLICESMFDVSYGAGRPPLTCGNAECKRQQRNAANRDSYSYRRDQDGAPARKTLPTAKCSSCGKAVFVRATSRNEPTCRNCRLEARRRNCEQCGVEFFPLAHRIASGQGRFCSHTCFGASRQVTAPRRLARESTLRPVTVTAFELPLTRGKVAVVDEADRRLVERYSWSAYVDHGTWYAQANIRIDGRRTTIRLHKLITGWQITDHINGDGLDNRRSNLRAATHAQNNANRHARRGKSVYRGVSFVPQSGRWRALATHNGQRTHIGVFDTEDEAARAYDRVAREIFGEFARLNFPEDGEQSAIKGE